jgi:hypothetical protein
VDRPRTERGWLAALLVLAVMLGIVGGGTVGALAVGMPAALPDEERPPTAPIEVAEGITITPAPGWQVVSRDEGGLRLGHGSAFMDVLPAPGGDDPRAILESYVSEVLEPDATQLSVGEPEPAEGVPAGLPGFRVGYLGRFVDVVAPLEGEVIALATDDGRGLVLDIWAGQGELRLLRDDLASMLGSLEVEP